MQVSEKIIISQSLRDAMDNGTLTVLDQLTLAAAQLTTNLFPDAAIYIGLPQTAHAPAFFIDCEWITNRKKLRQTTEFEFGLKITYVPVEGTDRRVLQNAMFLLEQNLDLLENDVSSFRCFTSNASIEDGLAYMTSAVKVWETVVPDDLIIGHADQNITS